MTRIYDKHQVRADTYFAPPGVRPAAIYGKDRWKIYEPGKRHFYAICDFGLPELIIYLFDDVNSRTWWIREKGRRYHIVATGAVTFK